MQEMEMEEREEIKEVGGRRYSKMSLHFTDIVTAQYFLEANSGDTGYRPLRSELGAGQTLGRIYNTPMPTSFYNPHQYLGLC